MILSNKGKEKIKKAYEIGDSFWLDIIEKTVKEEFEQKKSDLAYDYEENETILKLIETLYKMNYVIIETETEEYANKYYNDTHELYIKMKTDLMKMINYEEMWEEV